MSPGDFSLEGEIIAFFTPHWIWRGAADSRGSTYTRLLRRCNRFTLNWLATTGDVPSRAVENEAEVPFNRLTGKSQTGHAGLSIGVEQRRQSMEGNGTIGKWSPERMARGLGWFSIGLGLAEILAPRRMGKLAGISPRHCFLVRVLGLRELTSGLGILTQRRPVGWLWSRVGGDAMDLALLGASLATDNPQRGKITAATAAVAGVTALDLFCSQELSREPKAGGYGAVHVERSIIIARSPEELYAFWRSFQNLPRFMSHLVSVDVLSPTRSHWIAKGPAGTNVEWDAEIITDTPNEVIAWRSLEGADVDNAGSVRFERAPAGRGTIVRVKMQYRTAGGKAGSALAKLLGQSPEKQVKVDLHQFKQVIETGEVARTEGQPTARTTGASKIDSFVQG